MTFRNADCKSGALIHFVFFFFLHGLLLHGCKGRSPTRKIEILFIFTRFHNTRSRTPSPHTHAQMVRIFRDVVPPGNSGQLRMGYSCLDRGFCFTDVAADGGTTLELEIFDV
uniref:(northern house mosquito) hypothetical protein n=1 Tax=Culex pipiens TaxID=7175 RepID=A0A8D8DXQ6_CULPI